jgi:outer membrane protein OmpA-like peptidoglycan-associated protein
MAHWKFMYKYVLQIVLAIGFGLYTALLTAETLSDQLIVLNSDGLSYTAQQTLATEGELVVLALPTERISLDVQFSGPEKITFAQAHRLNPERLSLWSGSVFTRYRHHYSTSIARSDSGSYQLTLSPKNQVVSVENMDALHSSFTWVLPHEFELLSFLASEPANELTKGRWSSSGNTISYSHIGALPNSISLEYQVREAETGQPDPCLAVIGDSDDCSPDVDEDQVPDYRDICITDNQTIIDASDTSAAPAKDDEVVVDVFGCDNSSLIVLQGVRFQSGQSYLDVQARQVLDRAAVALQRAPDRLFEVASHTDYVGRIGHNQRLSENRADAVRHYLMLRGVGPNQLQARGYGETSPAHDNRLVAGRRANRRVELRPLE